ncbi:transmembrane signal peptide protein [Phyllobacterium phragmitis]|uniref:Transmembrane signal peptide protein n=1 Tax=Phyllobacterium phragmitis TaxID=2670329 RepID=A0A2S9IS23_9HYPH|nr:RcnB family protein [Phyllobacterium phragmitis]PRD43333.1 transmembrane signal peptide protein [Phyllobacterium phragmitis]
MKNLVIAVTALSILAPTAALAQYQPKHGYEHRVEKSYGKRHDDRRDMRRHNDKRDMRRHDDKRQRWSRGRSLPRNYRRNVVRDYGRHHLRKPARGQQWVRVNNDYLLISIASGVIASIVAGR